MDRVKAMRRLTRVPCAEREELCPFAARVGTLIRWSPVAAALADLSGWLEDAADDADLIEAVRHGHSLLNCGIIGMDEVTAAAEAIFGDAQREGVRYVPSMG